MPIRDKNREIRYSDQCCPPEPPSGDGDWELQYCNWSGWTWVKKSQTEMSRQNQLQLMKALDHSEAAHNEKKKKSSLWCFGKSKPPAEREKPTKAQLHALSHSGSRTFRRPDECEMRPTSSDECDDCCCYNPGPCCCCCNQVCCPCMAQACYCDMETQVSQRCKDCKTRETQTVKEVREQATKMSEMHVPKRKLHKRRRCRCMCRPVCCPCMRNTCCRCVQTVCCSSGQAATSSQKNADTDCTTKGSLCSKTVNYCLQNNLPIPSKNDFLNAKSTNFSTLRKSLDILLKNNINIMNLFDDKKEMQADFKPLSPYASSDTITCLSSDHLIKKTDPEHSKILTAVCDAILSSHKFDEDKFSSKPMTQCEIKDSGHCFSVYSSRHLLQKILSDLNMAKMNRSNDSFAAPREIGVQVENASFRRVEVCQPKRSLTRLVRNKSRILKAARFSKKFETLRKNIDVLRFGSHEATKSSRKSLYENRLKENKGRLQECKRYKTASEKKSSLTEIFKTPNEESMNKLKQSFNGYAHRVTDAPLKIETIEKMLNSIEYINGSTSSKEANRPDVSFQNRKSTHLLDATSPPFTDTDFFINFDGSRRETDGKEMKGSCSR